MFETPLTQFWRDRPDLANRPNKKPVTWTVTYAPLAASALQSQASTQTAADSVITSILAVQTAVGNQTYILTPLIIQIVITAINYNYNGVKTEWSTSGAQVNPQSGTNTKELPYPFFLLQNSTITTILDNPIATAANVWITFEGIQL